MQQVQSRDLNLEHERKIVATLSAQLDGTSQLEGNIRALNSFVKEAVKTYNEYQVEVYDRARSSDQENQAK